MNRGITWIRRRHRALARATLALFVLAWLQAAIVPCTMAHAMDDRAPTAGHPAADAHEGHHGGPAVHVPSEEEAGHAHCPYCPPGTNGDGADCAHQSGCAFPHDPRIDTRAPNLLFALPPCQACGAMAGFELPASRVAAGDVSQPVPRRSLSVRYCRLLE